MSEFDDLLRQALRRTQPPGGFARRVLRKAAGRRFPVSKWLGAAVAASLLLFVGGMQYRRYQGEKAKQQLMMAVEITAQKITLVRRNLQNFDAGSIQ
jgi:cobalamin biosynthesis protein CobD/CbiB